VPPQTSPYLCVPLCTFALQEAALRTGDFTHYRANRRSPIKRNVKKNKSPSVQCQSFLGLGIQPNGLSVHSYSESGLLQAKGFDVESVIPATLSKRPHAF
jgi:hypothetical protein